MEAISSPTRRSRTLTGTRPSAMPRYPTSTAFKRHQFPSNDLWSYNLDQTDINILSLTNQVAALAKRRSHIARAPVQRQYQSLMARPSAALWCQACRTKGHRSAAFSGSCNNRRLRREEKTQRDLRGDDFPHASSKHRMQSARTRQSIPVPNNHMSGVSRTPARSSGNEGQAAASL